jgi:predicted regulator of Ras-like GTPase activity (Roadblock/LC7/MglB family)
VSVDKAALTEALRKASGEFDTVADGMVVASADGLVLAAETREIQADTVAAMAVIVSGIATQLVEQAGVGESTACLFESTSGHVAVFPLTADMVVVVFGPDKVNAGMFNLAARGVLSRLQEVVNATETMSV